MVSENEVGIKTRRVSWVNVWMDGWMETKKYRNYGSKYLLNS